MNQTQTGASSSLLAALVLAVACGRGGDSDGTVVSTTTTTGGAAEVAGVTSAEEPLSDSEISSTSNASSQGASREMASQPARAPARAKDGIARAPHGRRVRSSGLDEAIRKEVETPSQNATPAPEPVSEVTTTSATLPVAQPANLAPARVGFVNRLPDSYRLERVRVLVDGATAYDAPRAGTVQTTPGEHFVQVIADYRLDDAVFTYVTGDRVQIRSSGDVPASAAPIDVVATAIERGGATTPMNKRATLLWRAMQSH